MECLGNTEYFLSGCSIAKSCSFISSFPVAQHTYTFSYYKDGASSSFLNTIFCQLEDSKSLPALQRYCWLLIKCHNIHFTFHSFNPPFCDSARNCTIKYRELKEVICFLLMKIIVFLVKSYKCIFKTFSFYCT